VVLIGEQGRELRREPPSVSLVVVLGYNLVGSHAYTLESIRIVHGKKCAILNNPWGFHEPKPIPLDQLNGRFQEIAVN
jgi:hypothetical protein